MKNCPFCNAEVADDVMFCPQCGADLENAQEAPVEEMPVQETPVQENQTEEAAYTEEQTQPEVHDEPIPTVPVKKKSPVGAIIACLLIIAVLCGGYFLYKMLAKTPYDRIEDAAVNTAKQESAHYDSKIAVGMQGMTLDVGLNFNCEFNGKNAVMTGEVKIPEMLGAYLGVTDLTFVINRDGDVAYVTLYPTDAADEMMTFSMDMTENETLKDFDIHNINKLADLADIVVDAFEKQFDSEGDEKLEKYLDTNKLRSSLKTVLTAKNMKNYCTVEEKDGEYHVVVSAYKFIKYALDTVRPAVKPDQLKDFDEAYNDIKDLEEKDLVIDIVLHIKNNLITDSVIKFESEEFSINATFEMSGFGSTKAEVSDDVKASYKNAQPIGGMLGGVLDDDYDDMD